MEIVKALYYFSINLKTVFFDFSGAVGGGVGGYGGGGYFRLPENFGRGVRGVGRSRWCWRGLRKIGGSGGGGWAFQAV